MNAKIKAVLLATTMLISPAGLYARGGGGCLEQDSRIDTPSGFVKIQDLLPGMRVFGYSAEGRRDAAVIAAIAVQPDEFVELTLPGGEAIRLTPEHPVAISKSEFIQAGMLKAGDAVVIADGSQVKSANLLAVRRVQTGRPAYNLLVSPGGTFFAGPLLVHNKGCFLPDTPIVRSDGSLTLISRIRPGDSVLAFDSDGRTVPATVKNILTHRVENYLVVRTESAELHVTQEHPFYVGGGRYKIAGAMQAGETIFAWDGRQGLSPQKIISISPVSRPCTVYNLQTEEPHTFFAADIAVHNKGGGGGCFLPDTPILRPDGSSMQIGSARIGDKLLAFRSNSQTVETTIRNVMVFCVDGYFEIRAGDIFLHVTGEHPFYAGNGQFRECRTLNSGDTIFQASGRGGLSPLKIDSIRRIDKETFVYNILTDDPHTFFAAGIAVHNKGGGGGCFLPDTPILRPDGSSIQIGSSRIGDILLAFRSDGQTVVTTIRNVMVFRVDGYFEIRAGDIVLHVTGEHPFYAGNGQFRECRTLNSGDTIYQASGRGGLSPLKIDSIRRIDKETFVYNILTDDPHTFFAAGIAVHNKGGGSSFRSSGSGGSGSFDDSCFWIFLALIFVPVILSIIFSHKKKTGEDLDYCHSRSEIESKTGVTNKLLEFISKTDTAWSQQALADRAKDVFLKLQECWQNRDYGPMTKLMLAHLHAEHCKQLEGMKQNHEINMLENLDVKAVDIVNVRYTHKPADRQFTALITARARDYYIDDRTNKEIRGDDSPATFQEFWTFFWQDGAFLLGLIEQTRESNALKDENFFEQFTDRQVERVTDQAVDTTGPAGPWVEKQTLSKATRIERMLNFLAETDKLWTRQAMLGRARDVFTRFYMAKEAGTLPPDLQADCFPEIAEYLRQLNESWLKQSIAFEYRNFCVRKIDIILVRNFSDNSKDEFVVRISAHAQRGFKMSGRMISQDEYVTPFEECWTFGRLDRAWKLKEIVPAGKGQAMVSQENIDEDSNQHQLKWYYTKKRTV